MPKTFHFSPSRRHAARAVILLALIALVTGARAAQPDGWSALVYDGLSGNAVFVASDGEVIASFALPRPPETTPSPNVAVSPDGEVLTYVAFGASPALVFYEWATDTTVTQPLPPDLTADSLSFIASEAVFTPDSSAFAFGYGLAGGGWVLQLHSRDAGWVPGATLDQTTPFPALAPLQVQGRTPIVQSLSANTTITFILAEPFSGYAETFTRSYTWDVLTNTLAPVPYPTTVDGDVRDGARVTPVFDETLPNSAAAFPYPQANTLTLTTPDGVRRVLFNTPNVSLFWSRFVGGGEAVLVGGYSPQNRLTWFLLDTASGDLLTTFPPVQMTGVVGTPDGFAYTVEAGANEGSLLYAVLFAGGVLGEPLEIWRGEPGTSYRVVWAG